jgi:hypothetical protein
MFTRTFSFGRNRALRLAVSLVLALGLVAGALSLAGCGEEGKTGNLVGTWKNIYKPGEPEEFITTISITDSAVDYEGTYKATIENDPDFEAKSGVLIIKFTEYTFDPDNVGKYSGLYWKDLKPSSVAFADAYGPEKDPDTGFKLHNIVATLEEARTKYTKDTVGNFVDWSITSPYDKY